MIFILRVNFDDHPESCIIGEVQTEDTTLEDRLPELWDDWHSNVFDGNAYSDFVDWLIENHGCTKTSQEVGIIDLNA